MTRSRETELHGAMARAGSARSQPHPVDESRRLVGTFSSNFSIKLKSARRDPGRSIFSYKIGDASFRGKHKKPATDQDFAQNLKKNTRRRDS